MKNELFEIIACTQGVELPTKTVKAVFAALEEIGQKELKKEGLFVLPGFVKLVVVKKPATKERQGKNPFTGEMMTFKAKPARKVIKARPVKSLKEAL